MYDNVPASSLQLASLFGDTPVAVGIATTDMWDAPLTEAESRAVEFSVAKRKQEFAAGRAAARQALSALGRPNASILVNADRSPRWPNGFVGSITHCSRFCGAVVATETQLAGIGFDAEVAIDLSIDIQRAVCTQREMEGFPQSGPAEGLVWPQIAFCAKEALYKCYYPIAHDFLNFSDVLIRFYSAEDGGLSVFTAASLSNKKLCEVAEKFIGRWSIHQGVIFAGVVYPQPY
jgi:4'-phosphopantetheinyl transferase EntD